MADNDKTVVDIFTMLGKASKRVGKNKEDRKKSLELKTGFIKNKKKNSITEFGDTDDWILSMILVAVMYANPDATAEEATVIGKDWVKKLYQPRSGVIWRRQVDRMTRSGIRAVASKIRRELYKLI